jgi:hypothetical protein
LVRRWHFVFVPLLILLAAQFTAAIPLHDYHQRVQQAIGQLNLLRERRAYLDDSERATQVIVSLDGTRQALPPNEQVEWDGAVFPVNNAWLHAELKDYEGRSDTDPMRAIILDRTLERLRAIEQRLQEIEREGAGASASKDDLKQRLAKILQRSEYAGKPKEKSALSRIPLWLERFSTWLRSFLPSAPKINPGRIGAVSRTAQIIVIGLALLVIAYVVWLVAPRLFRERRTKKKKVKSEARIVLGEQLRPDESALDLLADAEALARAGDLRGAIRKGYIALLVELADRRVISLAQYKTNRDYLRAVREHEPLHRNMEKLTSSFEVHWYGLVQPNENDWVDFRTVYRETLN